MQRGPDERDLLRHASRIRGKHGVRAIGQLEALEQVADALPADRLGNPVQVPEMIQVLRRRVAAVQPCLVGHDSQARADLVQAVGQPEPVELDQTRVGMQDPAKTAQRRGLAGAILAEHDQHLAALDMQVDAVHGADVAKALAETIDADHRSEQTALDLFEGVHRNDKNRRTTDLHLYGMSHDELSGLRKRRHR